MPERNKENKWKKAAKAATSKANASAENFAHTVRSRVLQEKYYDAVYQRNVPEIIKCLEKGVNPNSIFSLTGVAPLHILAERDDSVLGYRLLSQTDHDIDIDLKTTHGRTALQIACVFGNKKFAIMLLEKGANPNARDRFDRTSLHLAVLKENYAIVFHLLNYKADPNAMDCFENTPLSLSVLNRPNILIANLLLRNGVDLSLEERKSTLHVFFECVLACHTVDEINYVMLLLDNGIDINIKDKMTGQNCLHFVAITGFLELAIFLVERGANLTELDNRSRTPTKAARDHGNFIIADYFVKGYRPPNLMTVLPLVKKFTDTLRKRIQARKALEAQQLEEKEKHNKKWKPNK